MAYEAVIGLECHIQLRTRTKMFCECPAEFGAAPNSNVCPVCLGLPGALPVTNRAAIDMGLRLGTALECDIRVESEFSRKNYFYPDMPKNYQITQYDRPLCAGGSLTVQLEDAEHRFDLTRIHAEEDTGKSFHPERLGDRRVSRVDFNRAGVPLLELVTQPVFHRPAECAAFLLALRRLVRWLEISDGDMEKGHLRCDANVSLRPAGEPTLGTKTEIKNLNSIKGVERGIGAELARQERVLTAGGRIEQATLLYDADHDKLAVMRSKEHAHDYRYFPEPDLPPLVITNEWIADSRRSLPELPWARERRFIERFGLSPYDASVLCADREWADHFERYVEAGRVKPKTAANWILNAEVAVWNRERLSPSEYEARVSVAATLSLLTHLDGNAVTATAAKGLLDSVFSEGADPETLFARPPTSISSEIELLPMVEEVIREHPGPVAQYRGGKSATIGFLIGQVMKKTGGNAQPAVVRTLLERELSRSQAQGAP